MSFKIMNRGVKGHSKSSISLKLSTEHLKDKDQSRSTLLNEDLLRRIRDDFVQLLTLVVNELTCVKKHGGRARVSTVTAPSESQLKGGSITSTGSVTNKQPATLTSEADTDPPVFEDINEDCYEKYCEDIQKFVQAYTIQAMHPDPQCSSSSFKSSIESRSETKTKTVYLAIDILKWLADQSYCKDLKTAKDLLAKLSREKLIRPLKNQKEAEFGTYLYYFPEKRSKNLEDLSDSEDEYENDSENDEDDFEDEFSVVEVKLPESDKHQWLKTSGSPVE